MTMHAHVAGHEGIDGHRLKPGSVQPSLVPSGPPSPSSDSGCPPLPEIRTGIASGPLVAGVIGERKFSYDLWGDTVNTAARMESSGVPACIQVTDATCKLLGGRYPFVRREGVEVKGKGLMTTWTLDPSTLPHTAGAPSTRG